MRILSVSELSEKIKKRLEEDPSLLNVWVKGEISNLRTGPSGHFYFTLKDRTASIRVVLFRARAGALTFPLVNGAAVVVRGSAGFYKQDGSCRLYAAEVFQDGIGAVHQDLARLWQKLGREGLFDPGKKKPLPRFPSRVGVVTSLCGAALRDILRVLEERWPVAEVVVAPVTVQGEAAPLAIAGALKYLDALGTVDVIIIGRGGGTAEELASFNTEVVARAIHGCRVPVVAAVGHETDRTIADMVADARAATPSHAAAMVVPDRKEIMQQLRFLANGLFGAVHRYLASSRRRVRMVLAGRVFSDPGGVIVGSHFDRVKSLGGRLTGALAGRLRDEADKLKGLAGRLDVLSPLKTLARGYSICTLSGTDKIIREATQVETGDLLDVILFRGRVVCRVEQKESDKGGDDS
ncbi:MAG: exodeoxyribonuclease VII large subunit [Desulfotomaculales bacterium]